MYFVGSKKVPFKIKCFQHDFGLKKEWDFFPNGGSIFKLWNKISVKLCSNSLYFLFLLEMFKVYKNKKKYSIFCRPSHLQCHIFFEKLRILILLSYLNFLLLSKNITINIFKNILWHLLQPWSRERLKV